MNSPMCLIENKDGELRVETEAINYLRNVQQNVVVVSVVGLYRTGKSYLMNKLARKKEGFALGSTIQSKTKGIWMWCVPHPVKRNHTLVILDTEGLGDVEKGDTKNDCWVFALAILLSSTLVYNSRGTIDNQAVENLQYVTELTDRIKVNSSNGASNDDEEEGADTHFVQFFPNFVWAVRDFFLELKINEEEVTADMYLEHALELRKGRDKRTMLYNVPRECIRNYFPTRRCFVFPAPTSPQNMGSLETMDDADLCPEFREVTGDFCSYIFNHSNVKTVKGGYKLTGSMLGHLAQTYVETIVRGDVPCLENAVLTMAKIENESAIKEGLDVYQGAMQKVQALFPMDMGEFSERHRHANDEATEMFMSRSFKDENGDYLKTLAMKIAELYSELLIKNEEASEKKCSDLLKELHAPVAKMIQDGAFAQPGGYELYCTQHDDLVTKYRSTPNKGVRAEEVLENFLREKSAESNAILKADQKLTENEKKIKEEQEQVALAEQQTKALMETQQQLEKEMQERQRSNEETIEKLKIKSQQEAEQQMLEMQRAMDSKLEEVKKLQEKNFQEKEKLLRDEVETLRHQMDIAKIEENKEKSRNFTSMVKGFFQACSEGMSHYFNFKKSREERRALKYSARDRMPNAQGSTFQPRKGGSAV